MSVFQRAEKEKLVENIHKCCSNTERNQHISSYTNLKIDLYGGLNEHDVKHFSFTFDKLEEFVLATIGNIDEWIDIIV